MADSTNVSMCMYGNQLRLFGLGGGAFDTQALLDATIASMELKNTPYKNQLANFQTEKEAWNKLKLQLEAFTDTVTALKNVKTEDRKVSVSDTSVMSVTATNRAAETNYSVSVEQLASAHKMKTDGVGDPLVALNYEGNIQINGQTIEVTADMSLKDLVTKINQTSDLGVNAVIVGGSMVLTSTKTGTDAAMTFVDDGDVLKNLGLVTDTGDINLVNQVQEAKNAKFTVDGIQIEAQSNTVNDAIEGVNFTLNRVTSAPISVKIEQNNDLIKEKTQKFVNDFNTIIKYLNSITAKDGDLQGKTAPNRAKNDMVSSLTIQTSSSLKMYQIGISIDGVAKNGTLTFDATKLAEQLEKNPDEVMKLLTGANSVTDYVYQKMQAATSASGTVTSMINGIDKRITNIEKTISDNEARFEVEQKTLLKKFAQYEITMNALTQQKKYVEAQMKALLNPNSDD